MPRTYTLHALGETMRRDLEFHAGEVLDLAVERLPAGAGAVLAIAATAGGEPIAVVRGGATLRAAPADLAALAEGQAYHYCLWRVADGLWDLVAYGALALRESILPALDPSPPAAAEGQGSGTLPLGGSGSGTVVSLPAEGQADGSLPLSGAGAGEVIHSQATGQGEGALPLGGAGEGQVAPLPAQGQGAGSLPLGGSGAGAVGDAPAYPRQASTASSATVESGHSLTDDAWTYMQALRDSLYDPDSSYTSTHLARSAIPGSGMATRWADTTPGSTNGTTNARIDAPDYDTLVITERGPEVHPDAPLAETAEVTWDWLCRFTSNQIDRGRGREVILYSIWPDLRGPGRPDVVPRWSALGFRDALPVYGRAYKAHADYASYKMGQLRPGLLAGGRVWIIPGHAWMMRLHDDAAAGLVPGVATLAGLYKDDIHLNELGRYGLSCLHVTILYQIDLRTRPEAWGPATLIDPGTGIAYSLTPALRTYLQRIAWEVATTYEPAGMGGTEGAAAEWTPARGDPMPNWTPEAPVVGGGGGSAGPGNPRVAHGAGDYLVLEQERSVWPQGTLTSLAVEYQGRITELGHDRMIMANGMTLQTKGDGRLELYTVLPARGFVSCVAPAGTVVEGQDVLLRAEYDAGGGLPGGAIARILKDGVPVASLAGPGEALDLSYLSLLRQPSAPATQLVGEAERVELWREGVSRLRLVPPASGWDSHPVAAAGATFEDVGGPADVTGSASGSLPLSGAGAGGVATPAATGAGSGTLPLGGAGEGAATWPPTTGQGEGALPLGGSGDGAVAWPPATGQGAGTLPLGGAGEGTAAWAVATGSGAGTLPLGGAGSGTATWPPATGQGAGTLPLGGAAQGTVVTPDEWDVEGGPGQIAIRSMPTPRTLAYTAAPGQITLE